MYSCPILLEKSLKPPKTGRCPCVFTPTPQRALFPLITLSVFNLHTYLPMTLFVCFLIDFDINALEDSVISAPEDTRFSFDSSRVLLLFSSLGLSFWKIFPSFPYYLNVTASQGRLNTSQKANCLLHSSSEGTAGEPYELYSAWAHHLTGFHFGHSLLCSPVLWSLLVSLRTTWSKLFLSLLVTVRQNVRALAILAWMGCTFSECQPAHDA